MIKECDVLIIGAGPAGLTAALYAARAKMNTVVLDKSTPGGQIALTSEVANYPGSPDDTGPKLIEKMVQQVKQFGASIEREAVVSVDFNEPIKKVFCKETTYNAKAVIIATGANPRKINCQGESELIGKGVSYCATCDAEFFTDLEVFVVGGGDSALEEGMYLTKFARKVTVIQMLDHLTAAKSIQEKALKNKKMEYILNTVVHEIKGDGIVESIVLKNMETGELKEYFADEEDGTFGIFPFIGYSPNSTLFEGVLDMEHGYIKTDEQMQTNIKGVYTAGDVRVKTLRQVVTATADGAIAAVEAEKYIENHFST